MSLLKPKEGRLCLTIPFGEIKYSGLDAFCDYGVFTLYFDEERQEVREWTACDAVMSKPCPAEDIGRMARYGCDHVYVKCMEKADYYVAISGHGIPPGGMNFCEFHRPFVKESL